MLTQVCPGIVERNFTKVVEEDFFANGILLYRIGLIVCGLKNKLWTSAHCENSSLPCNESKEGPLLYWKARQYSRKKETPTTSIAETWWELVTVGNWCTIIWFLYHNTNRQTWTMSRLTMDSEKISWVWSSVIWTNGMDLYDRFCFLFVFMVVIVCRQKSHRKSQSKSCWQQLIHSFREGYSISKRNRNNDFVRTNDLCVIQWKRDAHQCGVET